MITLSLEASRSIKYKVKEQSGTINATGCGFGPHTKQFIFLFLCSGVETESVVEFRHSTRNASRSSLCLPYSVRDTP